MAKVFLDANRLIDLSEGRSDKSIAQSLRGHDAHISPLSAHILFYSKKFTVPNHKATVLISQFKIIDVTERILIQSMEGPTSDLEDNIQLHSAIEVGCDIFLTRDKKLLQMKFFGKMRITLSMPLPRGTS